MKNDVYAKDTFSQQHRRALFVLEKDFVNFHKDDEQEQIVYALWQNLPASFATQNRSPLQTDTAYGCQLQDSRQKSPHRAVYWTCKIEYSLDNF